EVRQIVRSEIRKRHSRRAREGCEWPALSRENFVCQRCGDAAGDRVVVGERSMILRTFLATIIFIVAPVCIAQTTSRPADGQQVCLPETDPNSPRKSKLKGDKPTDEIIRL